MTTTPRPAPRETHRETYRDREILIHTETGSVREYFTLKVDGRYAFCPKGDVATVVKKVRKIIDQQYTDAELLPQVRPLIDAVTTGEKLTTLEKPELGAVAYVWAQGRYRRGLITKVTKTRATVTYTTASSGPGVVFHKSDKAEEICRPLAAGETKPEQVVTEAPEAELPANADAPIWFHTWSNWSHYHADRGEGTAECNGNITARQHSTDGVYSTPEKVREYDHNRFCTRCVAKLAAKLAEAEHQAPAVEQPEAPAEQLAVEPDAGAPYGRTPCPSCAQSIPLTSAGVTCYHDTPGAFWGQCDGSRCVVHTIKPDDLTPDKWDVIGTGYAGDGDTIGVVWRFDWPEGHRYAGTPYELWTPCRKRGEAVPHFATLDEAGAYAAKRGAEAAARRAAKTAP